MKSKFLFRVMLPACIYLIAATEIHAQCSGGVAGVTIVPGPVWSSVGTNPANAGTYYPFAASAGNTYYFSFCAADGGGSAYDTQITILDNTGTYAGGYSDDFCSVQSYVAWPCVTTGTYRVLLNWFPCLSLSSIGIMVYRSSAPPTCPAGLGGGVTNIASLPYSSGAGTTCGMADDFTATNTSVCGNNSYFGGEDRVWVFTPTASGDISINLTSTGSYTGLMLYSGCPFNGQGGTCLTFAQDFSGSKTICYTVTNGVTYYLILDSWPSPFCNAYSNLTITAPVAAAGGSLCSNAIVIASLPFTANGESTACMGNDYSNASLGSCLSLYESGEDKVYRYVAAGSECIGITLSNVSSTYIGYQVYLGCPGAAGTSCIASNGGASGGTLAGSVTLPAAGTYYIIVDSWAAPSTVSYNISVVSFGTGPVNDRPCTATLLPLGIFVSGNNTCSGNADEPALPGGCFGWGTANTVWYRFTAPASGCIKIRTVLTSLTNTMVGVYSSGVSPVGCGFGSTLSYVSCNDDAPTCGVNTYANSELTVSGMTPGNNYYIMVDGYGNLTGSFSIFAMDGGAGCVSPFPPTPGQDCAVPNPVCQQNISVPNPGYQAYGSICDFGTPAPCTGGTAGCGPCATSCLCSGERGSSWYQVFINGTGLLEFDVVANDWPGAPSTFSTDYDWALYQTSTAGVPGPSSCSNLVSPIRCHYSPLGVTGCFGLIDGVAPPAYPGFGSAYRSGVNVVAGDAFLLVVSNYSNSTSGFSLIFPAASSGFINFTPPSGGNIIWTGKVNTDWFNVNNWGGCAIPTCDFNVSIPGGVPSMPVISAAGAVCRNMDIFPGATLTINSGFQLQVCRDFSNNGAFTANSNSTVLFQNTISNTVSQYINGNVTGTNKFWHLTASKPVGYSVVSNQNIDIGGNFTVTGAAFGGTFDVTNMYHKVAGNFNIDVTAPNIAIYNTSNSTLEFNGTAQTFLNRGSLNNLVMNQTGAGTLTLLNHGSVSAWMTISTGILTLTYGKIITGANRVDVLNRAFNAVSAGNVSSYVEGNLRRYLNQSGGLGVYDFPVGTSLRGYERISFNITSALPATVNYWTTSFINTTPATNTTLGTECAVSYHSGGILALDNGYWQIQSIPLTLASGIMNVTNYNRSWTTPLGAGWTVMFNKNASNAAANWQLNPVPASPCFGSPVTATQRNNMVLGSIFNSGLPVWIGTAQSQTPLPVELLSFDATALLTSIALKWITASETNNHGFELQRSSNGNEFTTIAWIEGNGTSTQLHTYSYSDSDVKKGIRYYYRLKQIDFNNDFAFSHVVSAMIATGKDFYSLMPNPYTESTNLVLSLQEQSKVHVEVTGIIGKHIATLANSVFIKGEYMFTFSAKALGFSSGIYLLKIAVNGEVFNELLVEAD